MAGSASTWPRSPRLLVAIAAAGVAVERVAICLDTAHLWGAGHPINTAAGVDRLVAEFGERIGLERLAMIHLNDSKSELGSRMDRHEHIGAGAIGPEGLRRILTHPDLRQVTYYLETPGMDEGYDAINAARARDLAEGRPLAILPPEAMNLPARGREPGRASNPRSSVTGSWRTSSGDGSTVEPASGRAATARGRAAFAARTCWSCSAWWSWSRRSCGCRA